MSRFQRTKDEYFLIALYEMAQAAGDLEAAFDKYAVGEKGGVSQKAVDAISRQCMRTNFIRKASETAVYLTPNGCRLVEALLENPEG